MKESSLSGRRVGVIGLGAMGAGMAGSLRRAGCDLHVCDVRDGVAAAFAAEGGTAVRHAGRARSGLRGGRLGGRQRRADRVGAVRRRHAGRRALPRRCSPAASS